nr:isoprenoid biosynthesis glyoxalase ElbB [Bacteroidales bacterium]
FLFQKLTYDWMKNFAVILSGCGVFDGAEIHESTLSLLSIVKNGAGYTLFAPDIDQHHVINHLSGEEMNESRNVLVESARIARGNIQALSTFNEKGFDALLFPGGFGVAKNLSDWAFKGPEGDVLSEVSEAIASMIKAKKPIGALCISPILLAKVVEGAILTIGKDSATANGLEAAGAKHIETKHGEVIVDKKNKLITSPCYMLDATIIQIAEGAENVIKEMIKLMT